MTDIKRSSYNPLICPSDIIPSSNAFSVIGSFNPAAVVHQDQTILLVRVAERPPVDDNRIGIPIFNPKTLNVDINSFAKDDPAIDATDSRVVFRGDEYFLTSISHFRKAVSADGVHFDIDTAPTIFAAESYETYGIEDPRIHYIEGMFYITYSAVSGSDIATGLMVSEDLISFERKGIIFDGFDRDVVFIPEKIDGQYIAFHRPFGNQIQHPSIRIAHSSNLTDWSDAGVLIEPRSGMWDSGKIGSGPPPFKTPKGLLLFYHGVNDKEQYATGVVLLDNNDPTIVRARSEEPLFFPHEVYEQEGFFPHTVFTNGAVMRQNGTIDVYYGACDETVCVASVQLDDILKNLNI